MIAIPISKFSSIMSVAVITGSAGLIGSEACKRFHAEDLENPTGLRTAL